MRFFVLALGALSLLVPVSSSHALIFGIDRRQVQDTGPGALFGPVGIVYSPDGSNYATAFLIDDCHAMTVQHVFAEGDIAQRRGSILAFNVAGPSTSWTVVSGRVVAHGKQTVDARTQAIVRTEDWAVLKLSQCLGKTFGHVTFSRMMPASEEAVGLVGYPFDRPLSAGVSADLKCHVHTQRGSALLHDCASLPGNSGGPLFRVVLHDGRPSLEVFALLIAAHSHQDGASDGVDYRVNYPDDVWNVATAVCEHRELKLGRADCVSSGPLV